MKRPLHRRASALLWALAFVLGTVGEGFGLRACPHHDATSDREDVSSAAGHGAHHAPAAGADCADPAATPAAGGHHEQAPGKHHEGPCTCDAACQAATGVALPGSVQEAPSTPATVGGVADAHPADEPHLSRPAYFLPFSLAPPHLG